ncbi:hypothetical protein SAMN05660464_4074 [Geodermatophilus dictyosporus]|uniref:Uncharacterized protein n=1 Tax=Geodermatophilus dictyosporus TaxID=1523247 RepID=A0A1I5SUX7_9ACTN|nr:hypothetical protein SAMN05660464_4074 [Geodermatophilus dictyosporus]
MPEAPGTRSVTFSRDWAGLSSSGRIIISIERVASGQPLGQILSHESAHDLLLKSTHLGLVQLALSGEGLDPAPAGQVRDRCARLLDDLIEASRFTHEAVATFASSIGVPERELPAYWSRHPKDYQDAAHVIEWLRARPVADDDKINIALTLGQLALAVSILDDWSPLHLRDVDAMERWLNAPQNRPDRRFPALSRFFAAQEDDILRSVSKSGTNFAASISSQVPLGGQSISYRGLVEPVTGQPLFRDIASHIIKDLAVDPSLPRTDRDRLTREWEQRSQLLNMAPTKLGVILGSTTSTAGQVAYYPPVSVLPAHPLVHVQNNCSTAPIPGIEPVGKKPRYLPPGDSALWFMDSSGGRSAVHVSPGALRSWLEGLSEDTTVCVRDGGSFLGTAIGEPRLRKRRHVVLVQNRTPAQVAIEVSALGLDATRGVVLVAHVASELKDVSYVLLRPQADAVVVILPTAYISALEFCRTVTESTVGARFAPRGVADFFPTQRARVDVRRVIDTFEGRHWDTELLPESTGSTPCTTAISAADKRVEECVYRLVELWNDFKDVRTANAQWRLIAYAQEVWRGTDLWVTDVNRRIDALENLTSLLHESWLLRREVAALRLSVEMYRRLLSELPLDWPVRFRYAGNAGQAMLRLWGDSGDDSLRREALPLLRAANVI